MEKKAVIIPSSPIRKGFLLAMLLSFTAAVLYLFWNREDSSMDDIQAFRLEVFTYLAVPFFSLFSIYIVGSLLTKKPQWILNEKGMELQLLWGKTQFYEWENISHFSIVHNKINGTTNVSLAIFLKDAEKGLAQMSSFRRFWIKSTTNMFGSPFVMTLVGWDMPIADCIKTVNDFIRENDLPSHLRIEGEADDFIIYQSLVKQLFLILISVFFILAGIFMLYRGKTLGISTLGVFLMIFSVFVAQFFDKNIRFVTSEKQKNKWVQHKYKQLIAEIGEEKEK